MPLPPLAEPESATRRLRGLGVALPMSGFLFGTLLAFNAAQTASLLVKPVSRRGFRLFNRWAADTWWGWCVTASEQVNRTGLVVSGDQVPPRENAIVVSNHQQMPDITFLMAWARQKGRLGDLKWIVKEPIKYVPGVGWGMVFLDCVFVKRNWTADRASVKQAFARLVEEKVPLWLISFPEGTRLTAEKLPEAQAYAEERGLPQLRHVLVPRTKGFVASVHGLRDHIAAIYDVTIGYQEGIPTLWQFMKGFVPRAHLHVRRYPIEAIPSEDQELERWIMERFVEKDQRLERFYQTGAFTSEADQPAERASHG